jgi:acyl-CoA thioester hydrolase
MSQRPGRPCRDGFAHFTRMPTRWGDNDVYGHVNNVVYYTYCETSICALMVEQGALDIASSPVIGLVVSSGCDYFSSITFPDVVTVGLKVAHLGNSSVRFELGLFRNDEQQASAAVQMTYVYVERAGSKPVSVPAAVRDVLASLGG